MAILAIDTSESHCSAALLMPDGSAVFRKEDIGRGHAERLLPMIEELLGELNLEYSALKRIAVVTGPGTFTGLRIGLSVARGLALALTIPCVGLMSLLVLAEEALSGTNQVVHVVIKGRGGQVFYQAYGKNLDGVTEAFNEPANIDAEEAAIAVAEKGGTVVGSGANLIDESRDAVQIEAVHPVVLARLSKELAPDSNPPEPTYLREADAIKAKPVFQVRT